CAGISAIRNVRRYGGRPLRVRGSRKAVRSPASVSVRQSLKRRRSSLPSLPYTGINDMRLKDASLLREQCLVDGRWIGAPETPVTTPATGEPIARVPWFGAMETTAAIAAAHRAFPGWAGLTGKARAAILSRWFDLITANRDDIALIMTSEQGKP